MCHHGWGWGGNVAGHKSQDLMTEDLGGRDRAQMRVYTLEVAACPGGDVRDVKHLGTCVSGGF